MEINRPLSGRPPLFVRWTIGDVSPAGFAALRLSVRGIMRLLGDLPRYVICVNSMSVARARRLAGPLPSGIAWRPAAAAPPPQLRAHLDRGMAEGTAWKLMPPQIDPAVRELALDNDVILWELPQALKRWLDEPHTDACLTAENVRPAYGRFAPACPARAFNSGIRGTPAGFDLTAAAARILEQGEIVLRSEQDEQGLQIVALTRHGPPLVVTTDEVTICSPFPPHQPELGSCGAHFVGLNAHDLPWRVAGRPASHVRLEHWRRHQDGIGERLGRLPEMGRQ